MSEKQLEDKIALTGKELLNSDELELIAKEVINTHNIDLSPAQVGYLLVYPNISKTCAARCIKANTELKHYSGFDYIVQVSGEVFDNLDEKTKEAVILHELLHVQPVYNDRKEEWNFKLRAHDFGDFYEINDKIGSEWYKTVQATVSSLYDLNPQDEGKVRL